MLQPNFIPFPELTTERLMLRKMSVSDAPEMYFLRSDAGVMKYIDREPAKSVDDAIAFIDRANKNSDANEAIIWAITPKNNPTLIGYIGFWNVLKEHYRAEVGYALHPQWHGIGLMTEALEAVLHYGFSVMKLHSAEANINPGNIVSMRLLERQGFIREAYFRENYYFDGRFLDSAVYSLITPLR